MIFAVTRRPVFSLNVHAGYACRRSGACCTAGWIIPVEPRVQQLIGSNWLLPDERGRCPQFEPASRLCRIHRDHGEAMLPDSCRHFPRRALEDERGTFVRLSHFCPTAASLLLDGEGPLEITRAPPAFPADRDYDGLDASEDWPPLLRPSVLFDTESFGLWERALVESLGNSKEPVSVALERIAGLAEQLRGWTVGDGPLVEFTRRTLECGDSHVNGLTPLYRRFSGPQAYVKAASFVLPGLDAPSLPTMFDEADAWYVEPQWSRVAPLVLRYLAATAFASWTAYQGRGIRTQIAELYVTASVLRVECVRACQRVSRMLDRDTLAQAVRASDLLLVHLIARDPLVAWLRKVEADDPIGSAV
jgi:hypothetical protein